MRLNSIIHRAVTGLLVVGGLSLVGCKSNSDPDAAAREEIDAAVREENARQLDAGLVDAVRDAQVRNGIITQHTLYPYHFAPGSDQLNELGQSDLAVMTDSFRQRQGSLSVRRGDEGNALYDARVRSVVRQLDINGIASSSVRITDGPPGGEGMSSQRAQVILRREQTRADAVDRPDDSSERGVVNERTAGSSSTER